MITTVTIDDQLLDDARELTGIAERSALLREGLRALIERSTPWLRWRRAKRLTVRRRGATA
jgi:hypothetical protein